MRVLSVVISFLCFAICLQAKTLEKVRKRGLLHCGVSQGLPGFSSLDKSGQWRGLDVDFCRAIAASIWNDPSKVKYFPLSSKERFLALQSGEIDILSRNTTWTISRDTTLGLDWIGVTYFDGQGFMVRKDSGVRKLSDLNGATICSNLGTTTELNVGDYFRAHKLKYKMVTFEKTEEVLRAYEAGRCDAYTTDQSGLYSMRLLLKKPAQHTIIEELISKEPLGPAVKQGDDDWEDLVRWTHFAMLQAEEFGLTSVNIDQYLRTKNPSIARLLGVQGQIGKNLNLDAKWAYQVIKKVGNYQESFDRNLGKNSPLNISRGYNRLWNQGGLHYPMPIR